MEAPCFAAGIGFVTGAFLGFFLSGHFTDELWIILLSALILGLILGFLATRLILLATVATILASNNLSIKNIGIIHNREFVQGNRSNLDPVCRAVFGYSKKWNKDCT